MTTARVPDIYYKGLLEAREFIPRELVNFATKTLKPNAKVELFSEAAIRAQKAYGEVADRTPYHESYTSKDEKQLTAARRDAYQRTFAEFLLNPENYP